MISAHCIRHQINIRSSRTLCRQLNYLLPVLLSHSLTTCTTNLYTTPKQNNNQNVSKRFLSKNKKQKQPPKAPRPPRPPKQPKEKISSQDTGNIPPLLLYQTASPNVFISSIAIDDMNSMQHENEHENQNDHNDATIHPKSLFNETKVPTTFAKSIFEYISPKAFNHELPSGKIPEIAVLGRSNVGKSSLLNALTNHKNLARISKRPGRTQQVNYFGQFDREDSNEVESKTPIGYIIDLPGYGYAKAPDDVVSEWQKNTQDFITSRQETGALQRIYILIDSRRGIDLVDSSIMSWLDINGISYTVVITKCDAVRKPIVVKVANEICMRYHSQMLGNNLLLHDDNEEEEQDNMVGLQSPFVHVTSSRKNVGIIELMCAVEGDFYVGNVNAKSRNYGNEFKNTR
mmetsp:Transcript_17933/g.20723  ORF Transcript_17933/g.20723 Transcript_17933/m.20723 type:complete len:402 (+) Transcript_17933:116-1321(+)